MAERFRIPWTTGKMEISQSDHPVTPPPELLKQWEDDWLDEGENVDVLLLQAFQAGADQELEACLKWLDENLPGYDACEGRLRAARRPKPPSLKKQALIALHAIATGANNAREQNLDFDTIRQALEQLDD